MNQNHSRRRWVAGTVCMTVVATVAVLTARPHLARAGWFANHLCGCDPYCTKGAPCGVGELGGNWYWLRSPDEEKRVIMGLYNRYCIRCHGVDGRGVWDIPDVPNFTNPVWQASRSDGQLARSIIEGRGSVMPPWRGTLTVEEACAMARYIRTFVPGTEVSRPDLSAPRKADTAQPAPHAAATAPEGLSVDAEVGIPMPR